MREWRNGSNKRTGPGNQPTHGRHAVKKLLPFFLAIAAGPGCATLTENKTDPLCAEIVAFANADSDGSKHQVALTTAWFELFNGKPVAKGKSCVHGGYAPGKRLCNYLFENSSTEFAIRNFNRALACVSRDRATLPFLNVDRLDISLSFHDAPGVKKGKEVGVEFTSKTETTPPLLTISVKD